MTQNPLNRETLPIACHMSLFIHLNILGPVPLKLKCKVKWDGLNIFPPMRDFTF